MARRKSLADLKAQMGRINKGYWRRREAMSGGGSNIKEADHNGNLVSRAHAAYLRYENNIKNLTKANAERKYSQRTYMQGITG